jgi:hypothetical protein
MSDVAWKQFMSDVAWKQAYENLVASIGSL